MNVMKIMAQFRTALTVAQEHTGDRSLSTNVKQGKIQICRVTYDKKGKSTVTPVTDYLPFDEALDYLNGMGA